MPRKYYTSLLFLFAFVHFSFFYYLFLFLRFRSVNCTIGPGSSEWFAVERQHAEKLRQVVLQYHRVDIFGKEGSWFLSPEFLVKHQIPFLHGMNRVNCS